VAQRWPSAPAASATVTRSSRATPSRATSPG
jgi:hypothetical protein